MTCSICDVELEIPARLCDKCNKEIEFENIIAEAFGISCFSYNSDVTDEFFNVMEEVATGSYNTAIAEKLGLKESHVELIQYLLNNKGHADYGTSPRGCWLTEKGLGIYKQLKELRG